MLVRWTLAALASAFVVVGAAAAATPSRWTPAQAAAKATVAFGVKVQTGGRYTPVVCKGSGKSVAGRYVAFQCSYTYRAGAFGTPSETIPVWVKVRTKGNAGACVSSTAMIPAGCLRATAALPGDQLVAATNAFLAKVGPSAQSITCVGVDGWYGCYDGGKKLAGVVVVTKNGTKVTVSS